ncbi:YggS family pyridoxal phosphate-dependent enzyme [Dermabacteraceae bacterium TAE3-ERU27]|nr:YggS family pyridoxal phosphate-dependent enzyme [Dermabacteraceae bacterium TAE3-ERU27]
MTNTPGAQCLTARIDAVLARIAGAAQDAGRDPGTVRLVLASKTRSPQEIRTALEYLSGLGISPVTGENRVQELAKHSDLADIPYELHMIGHLQRNKLSHAMRSCSMIHSLDRESLLTAVLRRHGEEPAATPSVLLQVNTSGEASKGGFAPEHELLADAAGRLLEAGVPLRGLMTIGARSADLGRVRASLALLRQLRDELALPEVRELSMGMSGDLELAIAEGASLVRVGSAVFGPRTAQPGA